MALQSSIVGRTVPTGLPCGGYMTVQRVAVERGFVDDMPVIVAELLWSGTGSDVLDGSVTIGSLAPGTALWSQLAAAGPVDRDA